MCAASGVDGGSLIVTEGVVLGIGLVVGAVGGAVDELLDGAGMLIVEPAAVKEGSTVGFADGVLGLFLGPVPLEEQPANAANAASAATALNTATL